MWVGSGVSAASAAQVGPSVLARNDVRVYDANLGHGQERTSWANQLRNRAIGGAKSQATVTGHCRGWFHRKMDGIAKAGHSLEEDGNGLSEVEDE